MAEAPELPADPLTPLPRRAEVVQSDPPRSRLPRVGVVLAAGRSQRLESVTGGGSKVLLRLGGLSLVERAVRSLLAAGLERVLVVVGHDAGLVATVVGRLGRGRVRVVYADRWADGNGASLAAVWGEVQDEALFLLVTADHVIAEGALARLLGAGAPAVLIDPAPARPAAWAEGTRVRVVKGAVVAFGRHLEEPAIDCGAFLLSPEVFGCQRQAAAEGDHSLAGAVTRLAQTRPLRAVALPAGCWWQDIDTPKDAKAARVALRRSLAKEADGPVSRRLNRPLSTRLSMVLAPLRPAPDLVSLVAFALGLAGAVLLAAGQALADGLLVHASSVTDGVDGELARLQLRGGPRGGAAGRGVGPGGGRGHPGWAGAVGAGRARRRGVLGLTVAATTGALLSMASKDRAAALGPPPAPERALGWLLGGRDGRLLLVRCGRGPGRPGRGPGRGHRHLGADARPTSRLRTAPVGLTAPTPYWEPGVRPASGGQLPHGQAARRLRATPRLLPCEICTDLASWAPWC
jgi:1L-myo-inositol 1-phosphate cytidylyltransferase / CDP-L-myo-inositol myo-inositolphosphotransferase